MVTDKVKVRVKTSCIPKDMEYEKIEEHTYDISVNSEDEIPLIVKRIVGAGGDIYQVSTEKMSLEEIYFSLIDRNHGEKEGVNLYLHLPFLMRLYYNSICSLNVVYKTN